MTSPTPVPGDVEVVRVERPASGGAVGRLSDGRVVFVRHALPGELVRAVVVERTSRFARADALEILEASAERVTPPCRYAGAGGCGGCDLQHASVPAQTSWKAALVGEHLRRIAGITRDVRVETFPAPQGSRTRLRCAVDDEGRLSLRSVRSHELVAVDPCWLADERLAPAFATSWRGADEVELRAIGDGEPFAVVRRRGARAATDVRSLRNAAIDPTTHSRVRVGPHVFDVSPQSFWQSHRDAPAVLSEAVLAGAQVGPGDHVADLFSGVGLFAAALARAVGPRGRVSAVESSPDAVADARVNLDAMGAVRVRAWSVTPRAVHDAVGEGDVVVLDPPRTGLARGVAAALVQRRPRRVVYVSCDAATFARDLRNFLDGGFTLRDLRVLDLFPMTEHVELVTTLDITP